MNIIEAFHFVFEADASKLDDGLEKSEKSTEKVKKGISQTDEVATKLGSTFTSLATSFAGLIGGVLALGTLKSMAIASAETTHELDKQAIALNVNTSGLYDWQNAVIASGGTAEGFNSTLENLNKITRDPQKSLLRLSNTFKGLSHYRAMRLGEQLGIDAGTAEMLRKGRAGVEGLLEAQRKLGTVTTEQVKAANDYTNALRDNNRVYDDVRRRVATVILPLLTKFLEISTSLVMFFRDNQRFTIAFFATVAAIITAVYLPAIWSAVAATYALLAPYILVGAAVALVAGLIALLVDDIMAFLDGNDSMIGELSKKWPIVGKVVKDIAEIFKYAWDVIKNFGAFLRDLFTDPAKAWDNFKNNMSQSIDNLAAKFPVLGKVVRFIADAFMQAGDIVIKAWASVNDFINSVIAAFADGIKKLISLMPDWLKKKLGITMDVSVNAPADDPTQSNAPLTPEAKAKLNDMVNTAQDNVAAMSGSSLNNQTSSVISSSRAVSKKTDVKIDKVEVVTNATDANGMAAGAAGALQAHLSSASDESNDGFLA